MKILEYLGRHPDASAKQVGQAVGIATQSARYHLALLRSDGRVTIAGERGTGNRGRPRKFYRLAERLRGNNLAGLADAALGGLLRTTPRQFDRVIRVLANALVVQVGPIEPAASGSRRLAALVGRLNTLQYEASWEAGAAGPRVLFGHCPYAAIIARHPELCQADGRMLDAELGVIATQTTKISPALGGQTHCTFVLK